MKRTYLITVNSKSKSTFSLEIFERTLSMMLEASQKKTLLISLQHIEQTPEEIFKLLKREGTAVSAPIKKDSPLTFQPHDSRGESLSED